MNYEEQMTNDIEVYTADLLYTVETKIVELLALTDKSHGETKIAMTWLVGDLIEFLETARFSVGKLKKANELDRDYEEKENEK